ncbi:hypothetical protein SAMN02927900_01278 [Rhizobium mongolense subsp. loessense]|uniref:Uncharacterized protein n=1 Tax=Rhizobium mongolense subsp. loessense TaxID=158890 RepID=A0A1G4Q369_9HYPH|nr:hypothetical protein [Rhizobium mongolense]SCW38907.1 hypothetical protein SAMN02927900_01278 [Rhizobium mongolense subsp. loessense]
MPIEIRFYIVGDDGELQSDSILPLSHFGSCPQIGDVICETLRGEEEFYSVEGRYFVQHTGSFGWAVILRKREQTLIERKLLDAWADDDEFWAEVDRKEEAEREQKLRAALMLPAKDKRDKRGTNKTSQVRQPRT